MRSSTPFGVVTILLVGDPAQLPPVQGQTLWNQNSSNADDSRRLRDGENTEEYWHVLKQKC
eukprot:13486735-Ditylum_brightwellii.AAC.1